MLPASSAMGEEHKPYMSSDVKEDELDDLSTFDAHSWALNHLSVEIKDEPKEEPVSGVEPDAADVEEWRFDGDAAPSSPRSPGGDSQQGEEEEEEEEEEKEKECDEDGSAAEEEVPKKRKKHKRNEEPRERKRRKAEVQTNAGIEVFEDFQTASHLRELPSGVSTVDATVMNSG
ncbi:uncharacterized protein [Anabrus simplex]|uniref:uncharacterized protein isoform X8 n=1 Tax=Anabrus simplex TaxID=316456 RepID=UPI0035A39173